MRACYDRRRSDTGISAAQNRPVIRICSKCGALLVDDNQYCTFCEVPPTETENEEVLQPVVSGEGSFEDDSEPDIGAAKSRAASNNTARATPGRVRTTIPNRGCRSAKSAAARTLAKPSPRSNMQPKKRLASCAAAPWTTKPTARSRSIAKSLITSSATTSTSPTSISLPAGALHGLLDSLDPQSSYLSPLEYKDYEEKRDPARLKPGSPSPSVSATSA